MNLSTAQMHADSLVSIIAPACERSLVVGSIRRRKPDVNDIDIVCIPKFMTVQDGMFDTETVSELDRALGAAARRSLITLWLDGPKIKRGSINSLSFDIYVATPETWATLVLIRTGSREHNVRLCQLAQSIGGKLCADGSGLILNDRLHKCESEEEVFGLLGMKYVLPEDRT